MMKLFGRKKVKLQKEEHIYYFIYNELPIFSYAHFQTYTLYYYRALHNNHF
jgi:hypothetical protein